MQSLRWRTWNQSANQSACSILDVWCFIYITHTHITHHLLCRVDRGSQGCRRGWHRADPDSGRFWHTPGLFVLHHTLHGRVEESTGLTGALHAQKHGSDQRHTVMTLLFTVSSTRAAKSPFKYKWSNEGYHMDSGLYKSQNTWTFNRAPVKYWNCTSGWCQVIVIEEVRQ